MRKSIWLATGAALGTIACLGAFACNGGWSWLLDEMRAVADERPADSGATGTSFAQSPGSTRALELKGKTQPIPKKVAKIAPSVLQPVDEVLVSAGDRVKAGQTLVKQDDAEPAAEVEARAATLAELKASLARLKAEPRSEDAEEAKATLCSCEICKREARHLFDRLEALWQTGSISEQRYSEARAALEKTDAEERAAKARLQRLLKRPFAQEVSELEARVANAVASLKVAQEQLNDYTVKAPIDGIISTLDVSPGTVSRPGTSVWGEILDLSEIDVFCEATSRQADQIAVGQSAEVIHEGYAETRLPGKVVFVGIAADLRTGLIPVLVRLKNPSERLRSYVSVKVRIEYR